MHARRRPHRGIPVPALLLAPLLVALAAFAVLTGPLAGVATPADDPAHLTTIDRKIADLTALRRELASMLDACNGGTVAECRILEALSPEHDSG